MSSIVFGLPAALPLDAPPSDAAGAAEDTRTAASRFVAAGAASPEAADDTACLAAAAVDFAALSAGAAGSLLTGAASPVGTPAAPACDVWNDEGSDTPSFKEAPQPPKDAATHTIWIARLICTDAPLALTRITNHLRSWNTSW